MYQHSEDKLFSLQKQCVLGEATSVDINPVGFSMLVEERRISTLHLKKIFSISMVRTNHLDILVWSIYFWDLVPY